LVIVAGVDDAGRGSVIGPLVIAGVMIDLKEMSNIVSLGVRDSKRITPKRRQQLSKKITQNVQKHVYSNINPDEIDKVVFEGVRLKRLNYLEAKAMAEVIEKLRPDIVFVDASDVIEERFARQIRGFLTFKLKIVSKHKADIKYPIVSAASIVAKVRRDELIESLRNTYGDFGSGYSHDVKTRRFIKDLIRKGPLPKFVRRSWKTIENLRNELEVKNGKKNYCSI
jgi:ribonuclease HII